MDLKMEKTKIFNGFQFINPLVISYKELRNNEIFGDKYVIYKALDALTHDVSLIAISVDNDACVELYLETEKTLDEGYGLSYIPKDDYWGMVRSII